MKNNFFKIGKKYVGKGNKIFIIAEIGVNHEGNFNKCYKLFEEAKLSGADAVKLQTVDVEKNYVQGTASYNEFKNTDFTNEEFYKLSFVAKKLGLSFFTTPGDFASVDKCKIYGSQAIKISSGLLTELSSYIFLILSKDIFLPIRRIVVSHLQVHCIAFPE